MADGDGGMPHYDHRIDEILARLDLKEDTREVRSDMRDIRERLTRQEEAVARLPGKGFVVLVAILSLIVVAALVAYQPQLQAFVRPYAAAVTMPGVATQTAPPSRPAAQPGAQ